MKNILHLSTTGKAVVDDSFLPQAHCCPQEGNYRAVCSKNDAPHCPEPSASAWPLPHSQYRGIILAREVV